jgi:hypothetical protein
MRVDPLFDASNDIVDVGFDFVDGEAEEPDAFRLQSSLALLIPIALGIVNQAVDLDCQHSIAAIEVDDEGQKGLLTVEVAAPYSSSLQSFPETDLCSSAVVAHVTGASNERREIRYDDATHDPVNCADERAPVCICRCLVRRWSANVLCAATPIQPKSHCAPTATKRKVPTGKTDRDFCLRLNLQIRTSTRTTRSP